MSWKQPIPVDIIYNQNLDFLDQSIYIHILLSCQKDTYLARFKHAGRNYQVKLERGQCILKIKKIADELGIDPKRVRKSIDIITNWENRLESKAMPFGLIVTVKNFDEIIKMESSEEISGRIEGEQKESRRRANLDYKEYKDRKDITTMSDKSDAESVVSDKEEKTKKPSEELKESKIDLTKPHRSLSDARASLECTNYYLPEFNRVTASKIMASGSIRDSWRHWRKDYSINDIISTIEIFYNLDWVKKLKKEHKKPDLLLRKFDSKGRPLDRIGECLMIKNEPAKPIYKQIPTIAPKVETKIDPVERAKSIVIPMIEGVKKGNSLAIRSANRLGFNVEDIRNSVDTEKFINMYLEKQ